MWKGYKGIFKYFTLNNILKFIGRIFFIWFSPILPRYEIHFAPITCFHQFASTICNTCRMHVTHLTGSCRGLALHLTVPDTGMRLRGQQRTCHCHLAPTWHPHTLVIQTGYCIRLQIATVRFVKVGKRTPLPSPLLLVWYKIDYSPGKCHSRNLLSKWHSR